MSVVHPLRAAPRQPLNEDEREAPSVILHACQIQSRWQVVCGIVFLPLAAALPWWLMEMSDRMRLFAKATGQLPGDMPERVLIFGFGCSFLALANAVFLFRCASGLRYFVDSRRVLDLHAALRRLRALWLVFGISFATVTAAIVWAVVSGAFVPMR